MPTRKLSDLPDEDEHPRIEKQELGTVLTITEIGDIEKTPVNGYDMITVHTKEHDVMVSLAKGVVGLLASKKRAAEKAGITISPSNPVECTVAKRKSQKRKDKDGNPVEYITLE